MKFNIQKYFETSTIHGLVYITKRHHMIERIFWIISIIFSVILTSVLIVELVIKLWNFPIVTYMSDQSTPVSEINFPAITVCPHLILDHRNMYTRLPRVRYEKHVIKEVVYESEEAAQIFADVIAFNNITHLEFLNRIDNGSINPEELELKTLKMLQVVDLITNRGVLTKFNFSIPTDTFLDDINEFLKEFATNFYKIVFFLVRQNQEYIAEIITQWGLCFTYNIAFSHDLLNTNATSDDFHYVYINKMFKIFKGGLRSFAFAPKPVDFPYKISSSKAGLWIGFGKDNYPFEEIVYNDFDGFFVLLHDPYELPSKNSKVLKYNRQLQTKILIDPQISTTDESLIEYEPTERNCYLEDEKVLKFFKVYTKNNCEQECLSDFMLSRCGCVEFFMIRNSTTRICSASERNCYKQADEDFEEHKTFCECFDPCNFVKFDFEVITAGHADWNSLSSTMKMGFQLEYKSNEIKERIRKRQFTTLDILSFVGGILGLFVGFSALSFVELIYWFTVRVWMANYKRSCTKVSPVNENQGSKTRLIEAKTYFLSYFAESSIHGLGYVAEFSWISRFLWITIILSSMSFCFHLILSTRDSVPDSRVIAFDDNFRSLEDIPFPAITIVPQFSLIYRYADIHIVFGPTSARQFAFRRNVPELEFRRKVTRYYMCLDKFEAYQRGYNFSFVPYVIDVMHLNSEIYWFRNQFSSFNDKYQPKYSEIRTPRGMGYTFNVIDADKILNFEHISSEFNYTRNVTTEPTDLQEFSSSQLYPLKFKRSDQVTFSIKMIRPKGNYRNCIKQSILIHQPDYLPTFSTNKDFTTFEFGTDLDVIVTPEITRTDSSIRKLSPTDRGCYFEGEKKLHFFHAYTQENCEIECLTNATFKECGCVDIDHPFMSSEQICINISRDFEGLEQTCIDEVQNNAFLSPDHSVENACSCLPLCNSIIYNIQYISTHEKEDEAKAYKGQTNLIEATINVRMNMNDIILYRRYQQFTFSDVVSYVGGLLGLFAGISMLSIVEFFYFFTIRLGVNLWRVFRLG